MKFLALNVDFDGLSFDFLSLRKSAHEGIKERYLRKSLDEMAGDRLTVCEQELLQAFARLVNISSNFLLTVGLQFLKYNAPSEPLSAGIRIQNFQKSDKKRKINCKTHATRTRRSASHFASSVTDLSDFDACRKTHLSCCEVSLIALAHDKLNDCVSTWHDLRRYGQNVRSTSNC